MVDRAVAEVEAGLYSEHPKLDVVGDIIAAELASKSKNSILKVLTSAANEPARSPVLFEKGEFDSVRQTQPNLIKKNIEKFRKFWRNLAKI